MLQRSDFSARFLSFGMPTERSPNSFSADERDAEWAMPAVAVDGQVVFSSLPTPDQLSNELRHRAALS